MKIYDVRRAAALTVSVLVAAAVVGTTIADAQTTDQPLALTPPSVPADIQVPAGNEMAFAGHAIGTQNYVCLPADGSFKFVLFTPQATLFDDEGMQLTTPSSQELT